MRIIYSAGNRIGANNQLVRFLDKIDKTKYEIKIAAYIKSSYSLSDIDWTLNSLHKSVPSNQTRALSSTRYNSTVISNLLNEVAQFDPDLIISDDDHIFGFIANEMNIKLWYCSPMLLAEGIVWDFNTKINYSHFLHLENVGKNHILPTAQKYLIYSPFCDIKNAPELKCSRDDDWNPIYKYNWVRPYFYKQNSNIFIDENKRQIELNKILKYINIDKNLFFTDGNTNNISDAIYNKKNIIISPSLNNKESLINSILIDRYKIGKDIGQVELMENFALKEIENSISYKFNKIKLINSNVKQLHEMIEDFKNSIIT